MGAGQATGRASGAGGLPAAGRLAPGDCYVWGAPTEAGGGRPAEAASGWQRSGAPVLVNDTAHLDIAEVRRRGGLLGRGSMGPARRPLPGCIEHPWDE
jgi:hypothetical protein